MSSSTSPDAFEGEDDWVPYSERPEWNDVQPLEQDDGDHSVVRIAYSKKCKFCQSHQFN